VAACLGVCADLCSLKDFLFWFKAFSVFLLECVASAFLPLYFYVQLVSGSVATRFERLSIGAITREPGAPLPLLPYYRSRIGVLGHCLRAD
jgi:hypothetical protein